MTEVEVKSRADLRAWLAANHTQTDSVLLVVYKKHTDHYLPLGDAITELLCWGWIDSVTRRIDADRSSYRIGPRNPKSAWSALNKAKIEEARASGQMTSAGEALVAQAKENGMWDFLDDVDRLEAPQDLLTALGDQLALSAFSSYVIAASNGGVRRAAAAAMACAAARTFERARIRGRKYRR